MRVRRALAARIRRFAASEAGSVTIEFVILFPVLVFFLMFIVAVSFYIGTASDLQQAAQALARASIGILSGPEPVGDLCARLHADVLERVISQSPLLDAAKVTLPQTCADQPDAGGRVTVTLTYDLLGSALEGIGRNVGMIFTQITRTGVIQL